MLNECWKSKLVRLLTGNNSEPVFDTKAQAMRKGRDSSFNLLTSETTIGVKIMAVVSNERKAVIAAPTINTFRRGLDPFLLPLWLQLLRTNRKIRTVE